MADDTGSASPSSGTSASSAASGSGGSFVALRSGLVIRHYVIEKVIGAGGFGITYRARHERLTSKVFALKEFFPRQFAARQGTHVISTPDGQGLFRWGLDRFLKEAEALAKCEHPGIVDVVDYFEENGTAYAVLGYVEGQQLGQWLDALGRPPTQAELDRILMPLLDALEVVHGARLLHRDIAPDNILIRRDGSPCLIDFGACREDIRDRSQKLSAIVKHGYSPPEQYHGVAELQGPWTDIYAVAATVYRAISGQAPMDSSRRGALGDTLQPVSEMTTAEFRPAFLAAIDAALKLKPDQRPQSVAEWRTMLLSEAPASAPSGPAASSETARTATGALDPIQTATAMSEASTPRVHISQPEAHASASSPTTASGRRGPLIAAVAILALLAAGTVAWWRDGEPASDRPVISGASEQPAAKSGGTAQPSADSTAPANPAVAAPSAEKTAADRAKAEADARANRQQTLDRNWQACRDATDATRALACNPVIQSDDTATRRAAALHLVGMTARNTGNYDKAIADFTQSLALAPDDAQALNDRGIAHFLKGGADGRAAALQDYDHAIRVDPRHAEALNNRAWSHFQAGQLAEALADANRSIDATPTNGYAFDTRGQILEALGRKEDAIRDFERALSLDPRQETSRAALARLRPAGR